MGWRIWKATAGRFKVQEVGDGKRAYVYGPDNFELELMIDHDDVNHTEVHRQGKRLIELLDAYWPGDDAMVALREKLVPEVFRNELPAPALSTIAVTQKPLGNGSALRRCVVVLETIVPEDADAKLLEEKLKTLRAGIEHAEQQAAKTA